MVGIPIEHAKADGLDSKRALADSIRHLSGAQVTVVLADGERLVGRLEVAEAFVEVCAGGVCRYVDPRKIAKVIA